MRLPKMIPAAALGLLAATSATHAETAAMNAGLAVAMDGEWSGRGTVLPNFEQKTPFRVKCKFDVTGDETKINLDGECGALLVKRKIAVALTEEGDRVTGTYEAALRTGPAQLSGTREDGVIDLDVEWGGEVNGDTEGKMVIERTGEDALKIVFRDLNPETGDEEVTTEFELTRG